MNTVRTRIAPSPTGYLHLGMVSRALINYALAKKHNGQFIWRNEDTDQERLVADALEYNMHWVKEFGITWDEGPDIGGPFGPYTQTERLEFYKKATDELLSKGYAYKCFCTKERLEELRNAQQAAGLRTHYDGLCRSLTEDEIQEKTNNNIPYTIRLKVPKDRVIHFDDAITHNHVTWNTNDVDDYVLVKSNGIPTYHLAVVVDDLAMKITHVLRGSEWLATTPVHLLVYEGLGVKREDMPLIGHFTVILDPNTPGKKFSKRNPAFRANGLLQLGYLNEAILNYLMLLGWAPKDNRELFTIEEFIQAFDLGGMQKANPTWDQKKMDWFNGVYSRKLSANEYTDRFKNWINRYLLTSTAEERVDNFKNYSKDEVETGISFATEIKDMENDKLTQMLSLVQERAFFFWDALFQIMFFVRRPKNIDWNIKQLSNLQPELKSILQALHDLHKGLDVNSANWKHEEWEMRIREIGDKFGKKHGDVFMALRVAIVGKPFSPPLFESLQILGQEEVLNRLQTSL